MSTELFAVRNERQIRKILAVNLVFIAAVIMVYFALTYYGNEVTNKEILEKSLEVEKLNKFDFNLSALQNQIDRMYFNLKNSSFEFKTDESFLRFENRESLNHAFGPYYEYDHEIKSIDTTLVAIEEKAQKYDELVILFEKNRDLISESLNKAGQSIINMIEHSYTNADEKLISASVATLNQADAVLLWAEQSLEAADYTMPEDSFRIVISDMIKAIDDSLLWIDRNRDIERITGLSDEIVLLKNTKSEIKQLVYEDDKLLDLHSYIENERNSLKETINEAVKKIQNIKSLHTELSSKLVNDRKISIDQLRVASEYANVMALGLVTFILLFSYHSFYVVHEMFVNGGKLLLDKIQYRAKALERSKKSLFRALRKEQNTRKTLLKNQEELSRTNDALSQSMEEIKKTREVLSQQEKLASIGQLAAGVAHEINNPLGFILSNINRLSEYSSELIKMINILRVELENKDSSRQSGSFEFDEEEFEYIAKDIPILISDCEEGGERVKDIVQSLKDFSRADDPSDSFESHDIQHLVKKTLRLLNNELKYNFKVITSFSDDCTAEILYGPMTQVFSNLVINAVHAVNDAQRPGKIEITGFSDENNVKIVFSDNGIGMSDDTVRKIFDPFFTTKKVGQGTGLGMNITYDIVVNRHNGRIEVESTRGEGSKFILTIPKARNNGDS
ncbi:sensor histidine kinase [Marinobacter sp. NSM]|uniref:sensor histidine kinase n=1 Tax=Marinobacter sp. NSM TaxID=3458004 RepID=UPI004035DEB2